MQLFAPNVMVIGDTLYEIDDAAGTPNPLAAAARYEAEVMALRAKILSFPFGKRWLDIVGNNVEPIVIVPTTATNDAVAQTFPNIPARPNRVADGMARGFDPQATGRGTPIRVKFNPAASVGSMSGGASGAVLLVHEVTHGYRSASGRFAPVPMTGMVAPDRLRANPDLVSRFPNWEEWLSIVVENVFATEAGAQIVRTHWDALHPSSATSPSYFSFWNISPPARSDSVEFADDYRPAILRMQSVEPPLFDAMLSSRAWFNPVRDFMNAMLGSRL